MLNLIQQPGRVQISLATSILLKRPLISSCSNSQRTLNICVPGKVFMDKHTRPMSSILYKIDPSPPARAVMMIIDILGIDDQFDMRELNPILREQDQPEFYKKNPMKTIPILDEGDYCLADSHAIALYLLEKYGQQQHRPLYPTDLRKRATIHQRLFFDCGILFPRLRAVMAPAYGGRITELSKFMKLNIDDAYNMLEAYLTENRYLADDVITVADICAVSTVAGLDGLHPADENKYPKLRQWLKNMSEQDYCKKINDSGNEIYVKTLKMAMEMTKAETMIQLYTYYD